MTALTIQELNAPYAYVISDDALHDVKQLQSTWIAGGMTSVFLHDLDRGNSRSILDLEGLGKEIWRDIDPKQYIDELRNEWNHR